jgi:hypothetical protein
MPPSLCINLTLLPWLQRCIVIINTNLPVHLYTYVYSLHETRLLRSSLAVFAYFGPRFYLQHPHTHLLFSLAALLTPHPTPDCHLCTHCVTQSPLHCTWGMVLILTNSSVPHGSPLCTQIRPSRSLRVT